VEEQPILERTLTTPMMPAGLAEAIAGIAIPAAIVPVRTYAGETEDEALARYGMRRDDVEARVLFLNLG